MSIRNCRPRLNTCRGTETCTAQTPSTYKVPFSWRPLAEWAQGKQAGWRKWLQPFICLVGFEISFYLEGKAGLKVNFLALENLIVSALSQPIPEPDHSCPSMSHVSKLQSQFERARSVETQGIVKVSIPASVSAERSRLCANTTLNSTPRCWCRWNPRYPGYLFRNGTSRRRATATRHIIRGHDRTVPVTNFHPQVLSSWSLGFFYYGLHYFVFRSTKEIRRRETHSGDQSTAVAE